MGLNLVKVEVIGGIVRQICVRSPFVSVKEQFIVKIARLSGSAPKPEIMRQIAHGRRDPFATLTPSIGTAFLLCDKPSCAG